MKCSLTTFHCSSIARYARFEISMLNCSAAVDVCKSFVSHLLCVQDLVRAMYLNVFFLPSC